MAECDENNIFSDNVMTVRYVPIYENKLKNLTDSEEEAIPIKKNCEVEAVVDQVCHYILLVL